MFIDPLIAYCRRVGYVTEEQELWIKYILEKKVTTTCVAIPFFILGIILTSLESTIPFFVTFYLLRSRINGFHAKTFFGCFVASLVWEYVFLGIVSPNLTTRIALYILATSTILILVLAPFRHPNMPLTESEYLACKLSARFRVIILATIGVALALAKVKAAANGVILGIAMAALMLIMAYLHRKGVDKNEKAERKGEQADQKSCLRSGRPRSL